ncbi:MAG: orotidine-5'-phosphate decarboxylase [SAR324 cluster bacterium]
MARSLPVERRLIFALDVPDPEDALAWVRKLKGAVHHFKVGLELFLAGGWDIVHAVAQESGPVFLDIKLLDIPATTERALLTIAQHTPDVWLANTHLFNGMAIGPALRAGLKGLNVLTVPMLTSMSQAHLKEAGIDTAPSAYVVGQAVRAKAMGYDGVVASGWEAAPLRAALGADFLIVCPGIRPAGAARQDQSRVMTPGQAIRAGASYLVAGRPIRDARDPVAAARAIQDEIAGAV